VWLPGFGLLLKSWHDATKKVLTKLRRSHYKELSYEALELKYSPIPIMVVVERLVEEGIVEIVNRPSGLRVKLL